MHDNIAVRGARGRAWSILLAGAVWLGSTALAFAQGAPPDEATKHRAQTHYQAGVSAYNVGDFDNAIREWKEGYRVLALPDFLFNIAQAYRGKGDHQNALFFYNAFLRERPDAPNVNEVVALRDETKRLLSEQRTAPAEDDAITVPPASEPDGRDSAPSPPTASAQDSTDSGGRSLRLTGLMTAGGGVALLATGVVFSLAASSAASDLEGAAAQGAPWTPALEDKERAGRRNETLGIVFLAAGSAAVITGAVTYYLGRRRAQKALSVAVLPIARGGVFASVEF